MDEAGIMEGLGENGLVVGSAENDLYKRRRLVLGSGRRSSKDLSTFSDWQFTATKNGWTSDQTAVEWLEKVFIPRTQPPDPSERRLLVLDGHGSHETVDFMSDFSLLTDSSPVGKQNFLSCYQKAREQALTVSNIKGGWKATDCVVDPEALARSEGSGSSIQPARRRRAHEEIAVQEDHKGFDEKDGLLAKAQLQIQALETQLAAVKPKKEEGGHEPEFEVRQY
ncbi:DDE superfamily endonuclease domain-containing protein [Hirsutella rhossiliensis]|uniref:DDE superfamily endonuclease domain-containing protein n=1 Tax=Hirsutella rhossiliensis TaxID=111463 RepID=A0A9P8MYJ2_9HYPO|nr:DDE superfamily endonuclease domain-containing protein [Hirsutella rhossiliensis]KAH0963640.1 DDE superfamily endonuclease domain-containing protein [Hirsutella rhossiliensis]